MQNEKFEQIRLVCMGFFKYYYLLEFSFLRNRVFQLFSILIPSSCVFERDERIGDAQKGQRAAPQGSGQTFKLSRFKLTQEFLRFNGQIPGKHSGEQWRSGGFHISNRKRSQRLLMKFAFRIFQVRSGVYIFFLHFPFDVWIVEREYTNLP